jgi:23S rRNA pseudouridine1911/1915/1917 synthase
LAPFPRQALHARRLAFDHPLTAESLVLQAPVPKDLQTLLDALMRGDPL